MALSKDTLNRQDGYRYDHWIAIDFIEEEGGKSGAKGLFEHLKKGSHEGETQVRMAYAIGRLGDRSLVPGLINELLNNQELRKRDFLCGSIVSAIVMLGGQRKLADICSRQYRGENVDVAMKSVDKMLGDSSSRQELVRELDSTNAWKDGRIKAIVLGMLGDISVARDLVKGLSQDNLDYLVYEEGYAAIGRIGKRLTDPSEVKELSDRLVEEISKTNLVGRMKRQEHIAKAIGELGKRLAQLATQKTVISESQRDQRLVTQEDAKELSKKLVRNAF